MHSWNARLQRVAHRSKPVASIAIPRGTPETISRQGVQWLKRVSQRVRLLCCAFTHSIIGSQRHSCDGGPRQTQLQGADSCSFRNRFRKPSRCRPWRSPPSDADAGQTVEAAGRATSSYAQSSSRGLRSARTRVRRMRWSSSVAWASVAIDGPRHRQNRVMKSTPLLPTTPTIS
jgi:hypothetical protein